MSVEIATAVHRSQAGGETVYFCCRHCKETFDRKSGPRLLQLPRPGSS
jgi:YHS domain-containing protein